MRPCQVHDAIRQGRIAIFGHDVHGAVARIAHAKDQVDPCRLFGTRV